MKITWLGHSCFKIETNNESIVLDPYKDGYVDGLAPLREIADLVLCSHEHGDHGARECVQLTGKETHFKIETISSYHDDKQGTLRGNNIIHKISDGTYTLAHLGDLGCPLTNEQINHLKNLDVLLIPVGGFYTIDSQQARIIVEQIQPKITIPMHYKGKDFGYDVLETVEPFLSTFENVTRIEGNSIRVENHLDNPVIVLNL
ncbi:MAG: MBL fold metallo-hydrolase [Bacillota bacterium]|nr:MBL fold metallo-hydrolase [Bacillota bacterium]